MQKFYSQIAAEHRVHTRRFFCRFQTNAKARVKAHPAGRTSGLLPPPPPGGATVLPPPANTAPPRVMPPVSTTPSSSSSSQPAGNTASLLDLDGPTADATSSLTAAQQWSGGGGGGGSGAANADPWGDFTSARCVARHANK